jgi:hypothetical protein
MNVQFMLELLIYLLLGGLVVYAVYWIVGMIDLPPEVKRTVTLVFAVLVIVWLVYTLKPDVLP